MLIEVSGDILESSASTLVHGVAPNDPFQSGLALQLRERYPAMFRDFRHYCQGTHVKPGEIWFWAGTGPHGVLRIVALLTQDGGYEHGDKPGRASLVYVNHALKALRTWIDAQHPRSVAIPRLATGVGGLDWQDVRPIVQRHLANTPMPIYLYSTYRAGAVAEERPMTRSAHSS